MSSCSEFYSPIRVRCFAVLYWSGFIPSVKHQGLHPTFKINYYPNNSHLLVIMSPHVKIVQPSGLLDSTSASQFREEINEYIVDDVKTIIIDFQDVTFMDSSGLGALVMSLKAVRTAGGEIFLCSINEQIRMLFELTNMDRVFQIFPNREELEKHLLYP